MSLRKNFKIAYGQTKDSILLPELEFRLGHVEKVVTQENDLPFSDEDKLPRQPNAGSMILLTASKSLLPSKKKTLYALPLIRGVNDSITRGDVVLWVNVGGEIYYLGPINTTNNPNQVPNSTVSKRKRSSDARSGYGALYPFKNVRKLEKHMPLWEYPNEVLESAAVEDSRFTDLTLEGRHGNSIRVGSNARFPNIIISNKRARRNSSFESPLDGSFFGMYSMGSLWDNLPYVREGFKLSCDSETNSSPENNPRGVFINMGNDAIINQTRDEFKDVGGLNHENKFNYDLWIKNQTILISDRIIFDAKREDLTLSANRNINLGAGKNFTLSNKGFSVIETRNIYIGKEAKRREQPMVLGEELRKMLEDMVNILSNAHALVQGVPVPLVDNLGAPLSVNKTISSTTRSLTNMLEDLQQNEFNPQIEDDSRGVIPVGDRTTGGTTILSNHHFIEPNRS